MELNGKEVTKITQKQFAEGLKTRLNMLVFGPSGYGKTAIVEEYAREAGLKIAYVDMAGELPESIAGIPAILRVKDEETGYYRRMLDVEIKDFIECEGRGYILFFDEINQGSPDSLNTLYGITHPDPSMRRWCGHRISECQIVACGNLADGTDGTVYLTELPTPLLNRFFVFELKPNKKDAETYLKAKYKNIPQVSKYIKAMQENNIAPRDIDQVLRILQYEQDSMFLEAKLGSALTAKIYELQKSLTSISPTDMITNAKAIYEQLKENGSVKFGLETITTEGELKTKLSEMLSEEEIKAVFEGGAE